MKGQNVLKQTLVRLRKLDPSEKKLKRNLGILELFCTILQKEICFDIMKIELIIIRKELIDFDKKLPFLSKIFTLNNMCCPEAKTELVVTKIKKII